MKKLFILPFVFLTLSTYASAEYPYKMDNEKFGKIITKAAFYHGLHGAGYVFGSNNEDASVERVKNLKGLDLIESAKNIFNSPGNLSRATAKTKKVELLTRDEGKVSCYTYIEYSKNSKSSPQVLANVDQYDCENESGDLVEKYNFRYTRLESSLIMAGKL